jgi:hypothetical protein
MMSEWEGEATERWTAIFSLFETKFEFDTAEKRG